jgi:hypothetical protein
MRRLHRRWRARRRGGPVWLWHGLAIAAFWLVIWGGLDLVLLNASPYWAELVWILAGSVCVGFGSWLRGEHGDGDGGLPPPYGGG